MEDRLYKFARLIDAGSFTKAAAVMHISQPALTTAIKKLERELHTELLIRDSHTFKLTAAGAIAYETAKQLGIQAHNLKLRLAEAGDRTVPLNLGAIDSIAELLFVHGDNLRDLERGTRLSLTVDNSTQLIKYIEHDELDIALIAKPTSLPAVLLSIELGEEPLVFVTAAAREAKTIEAMQQQRLHSFLSYNLHSHTERLVRRHFEKHDIVLKPSFHSTSPEIMLQLVLARRGSAVLPYLLVKPYLEKKQLATIQVGDSCVVTRPIVSIHRAGKSLPDQVTKLLASSRTQLDLLTAEAKLL